jgi:LmbE family N-acetylglucosaminyl deacetylase
MMKRYFYFLLNKTQNSAIAPCKLLKRRTDRHSFDKYPFILFLLLFINVISNAQAPARYTSSDIYLRLQKLRVLGSVLYIAAHPDDENTRLIAYLSKERLYNTGYLSLTRGDGGQNLIGSEQGIDLGLIRTQELLAARRIDGAEQFFSRAFDFGFSKSTDEALKLWDREKILSDVVWVIRKFQPDIIITRFPEDSRAGHGQHSGSSVLAHEAFKAAADPARFPEQYKYGVKPWAAKRIFWNTYIFGNVNAISDDQIKIEVGGFNPVLGKSYGEIAAESRSQHKSQGFGAAATRGAQLEYFNFTEGSPVTSDIMDGVETSWKRVKGGEQIDQQIVSIIKNYSLSNPEKSVPALVSLYRQVSKLESSGWKRKKLNEIQELIEATSGLWLEAFTNTPNAIQGDSIKITAVLNNRLGQPMRFDSIAIDGAAIKVDSVLAKNINNNYTQTLFVPESRHLSQPYWLEEKMESAAYTVKDQTLIGKPENDAAYNVSFVVTVDGQKFVYTKPVRYKFSDPVKGELYEPLVVVPPVTVALNPPVLVFKKDEKRSVPVYEKLTANRSYDKYVAKISAELESNMNSKVDSTFSLAKGASREYAFNINNEILNGRELDTIRATVELHNGKTQEPARLNVTEISYDHIPDIYYFHSDIVKVLNLDIHTAGKRIGYIEGAGDKVLPALQQLGYEVVSLREQDITPAMLESFDAVITGVRAYNVHPSLIQRYDILMDYVKNGGNLIVQYNTVNQLVNQGRIGPYPFTISSTRITDETAPVKFAIPDHPVLNYPNKITEKDFSNWIQERGIYFADKLDSRYQTPLLMNDPGEADESGSLIIADYGKGKFVYTGLVFFRELPAGVPGAYRLLANIIALNQKRPF